VGAAALLGALLSSARPASAIGSVESDDGEQSLDAIGSARLTAGFFHFREGPEPFAADDDGVVSAVLRLILTGSLAEQVGYEVNLYSDLSRVPTSLTGGSFATASAFEGATPYRTKYLSWQYWERGSVQGSMGVDRLRVDLDVAPVLLSVGRFPVNYSVTHIFAPNDFFAPFSATAINTIYKPGVDAQRLLIGLGELSGIEAVQVLGYDDEGRAKWSKSAALGRASTVLWDFEWALLGGKLAERWVGGGSLQGELGPIGLRAEGHVGVSDGDGDGELDDGDRGRDEVHGRVAAGLDVPFEWHNANIAAEYSFVSDGAGDPADYLGRAGRWYPDDQPFLGRHYVGASVRGEIIPILLGSVMGLVNVEDGSGLAAVSLLYSVADEADLVAGVQLPWGPRPVADSSELGATPESEMGLWPLAAYAESRIYF
jgi:hypothetical protein